MVFRAYDSALHRPVAVKVLDPQYAKDKLAQGRFCREARSAAGLTHENVVTIHHVETCATSDLSYIVMQFVPGRSLQDRLDEGKPLPDPRGGADRRRDRVRPGRRPRPGAHPSGHQARQHPDRRAVGPRPAHGLRPRPADRGREADPDRVRRGHPAVHEPRTGPGGRGRRPVGPVQPGKCPLRDARRRPAVPGDVRVRRPPAGDRQAAAAGPGREPRGPGHARGGG